MTSRLDFLHVAAFATVMLCWMVFASAFLFRKKPPRAPERKRDRASMIGLALQGIAYAMVWSVRRPLFTPIAPLGVSIQIGLSAMAVALAVGSVWMALAAVRALGTQWSLAARLVEEHKLVTEGPYRLVRHPIYTGMFGMLLATGLVVSHWSALLLAAPIYWIGTAVRVGSEERLLREAFGPEFEAYVRRVPALFPRLR